MCVCMSHGVRESFFSSAGISADSVLFVFFSVASSKAIPDDVISNSGVPDRDEYCLIMIHDHANDRRGCGGRLKCTRSPIRRLN